MQEKKKHCITTSVMSVMGPNYIQLNCEVRCKERETRYTVYRQQIQVQASAHTHNRTYTTKIWIWKSSCHCFSLLLGHAASVWLCVHFILLLIFVHMAGEWEYMFVCVYVRKKSNRGNPKNRMRTIFIMSNENNHNSHDNDE